MMDATEILEKLYAQFGTDTGILFGIPATHKTAVLAVIECVIDIVKEEEPVKWVPETKEQV